MTTKTPMPTWLKNQLIDRGLWNTDGITRQAQLRIHTCGQTVLTGLDADTAAGPATCDPTWLTPLGEALAAINHQPTYDYWLHTNTLTGPRRATTITYRPATNTGTTRVLAAHTCTSVLLPHYDIPTPATKETNHDQPPY